MFRYAVAAILLITPQLQSAGQSDFRSANQLFHDGKLDEALAAYQKLAAADPEHSDALYNGGLAAFLLQRFEVSRDLWLKAERLDSEDTRVKEKLIQAYRRLGMEDEAVRRTVALTKWRTKNKDYRRTKAFVCDQFSIGEQPFVALREFEFPDGTARKFTAYALDTANKPLYSVSFSSNPVTNAIARDSGELAVNEKIYHIEASRDGGRLLETYVHTKTDLSYAQFKKQLVLIVEGKREPLSYTRRR